jgi:hypothetical protein
MIARLVFLGLAAVLLAIVGTAITYYWNPPVCREGYFPRWENHPPHPRWVCRPGYAP